MQIPPPPPVQIPPPPPHSEDAAPTSTDAGASVPWTGRDLIVTLLAGGGLGLVLGAAVFIPIAASDWRPSTAAQLTLVSLLLYGSVCGVGWLYALKRHGATLADAGFRWVGIGPVLLMIPGAIGLMIVNGIVLFITNEIAGNVPTAQDQVLGGEQVLTVPDLVWLLVAAVLIAPFAEEFLFRGLLYRYVRYRRTILMAMVVSSLAFAVAHFVPILIPSYFFFGLAEAFAAERYKSLYPSITLHALNNGTLLVTLYYVLNA